MPDASAQNEIAATVDGETIFMNDLDLAGQETAGDPDIPAAERRRILLELLVQRQILANAARKEKLEDDIDYIKRSIYMRRTLLQEFYLEKRIRELVTEADARRVYDQQAANAVGEEELQLRHILTEKRETAAALRERLAAGADFAAIARTVSIDAATASKGGDLGWRSRNELSPELAAAAFALPAQGAISAPVQSPAGWHLLMLAGRQTRKLPPFDELKVDLLDGLFKAKAREVLREMRSKATIVYGDKSLRPKIAPMPPVQVAQSSEVASKGAPSSGTEVSTLKLDPAGFPLAAKVSHWRYGGSRVKLYAVDERLTILVEEPDAELTSRGWTAGTLIFEGNRRNGNYNGYAPSHSPQNCGLKPFSVSGKAASDGNSFSVSGKRPLWDGECRAAGEAVETLVFEYIGPASE